MLGVINISKIWTAGERASISEFLAHAASLLFTNQFKIEPTIKNKEFDKQFPLRHDDKKKILKSLKVDDCVAIEPNDNPRYPDSTVFKFIKEAPITSFGETKDVVLYIKTYIIDKNTYEMFWVISFHEEGQYD